jgi:hypothetical protein
MKRVLLAVLAVTVLLLYPSSYLIAGSPASYERPNIMTPKDNATVWPVWDPPGILGSDDDEDDKGDADDLAGLKDHTKLKTADFFEPGNGLNALAAVKIYWMYFFIHVIR